MAATSIQLKIREIAMERGPGLLHPPQVDVQTNDSLQIVNECVNYIGILELYNWRVTAMKKPPEGWPRISSAVFYDDAGKAIDWLCAAFGFDVRLKIEGEGGRVEHSELTFGDGLIMVGNTGGKSERPVPLPCKSPRSLGGANTQRADVLVDVLALGAELPLRREAEDVAPQRAQRALVGRPDRDLLQAEDAEGLGRGHDGIPWSVAA